MTARWLRSVTLVLSLEPVNRPPRFCWTVFGFRATMERNVSARGHNFTPCRPDVALGGLRRRIALMCQELQRDCALGCSALSRVLCHDTLTYALAGLMARAWLGPEDVSARTHPHQAVYQLAYTLSHGGWSVSNHVIVMCVHDLFPLTCASRPSPRVPGLQAAGWGRGVA